MDIKIHRFTVGWEGDVLEIVNPSELKVDDHGGLMKAVWKNEKGIMQTIEWDDKEKKYTTYEEHAPVGKPKRSWKNHGKT
jgi:hypothetical protein